jgi:hypothetical protein
VILRRWARLALFLLVLPFSNPTARAAEAASQDERPMLGLRVPVTLELLDGREMAVTTLGLAGGQLRVRSQEGTVDVPIALIVWCRWGEHLISGDQIPVALERWGSEVRTRYPHPPAPHWTGLASAVYPGAGHALLGDWRSAGRYGLLEAVFLGTTVFLVLTAQAGAVLPVAALDMTLRAVTVAETVREARRRDPLQVLPN